MKSPAPVATTDTLPVTITDIAYGGDGVGRLPDGITVFVPYAAVGDELLVLVHDRHKRFARARIAEIVKPGPGRTTPACPVYGRCGGCQYQHLELPMQRQLKADQLVQLLQRVGGLTEIPTPELLFTEAGYGYRNKLSLEAQATPPGGMAYYGMDAKDKVVISDCPLAQAPLNARLAEWQATPPPYPAGETVTLRADATGRVKAFVKQPSIKDPWLHERLMEREFLVPPAGFFQVNPPVVNAILAWLLADFAAEVAERGGTPGPLLDAYCGVGVFALTLAQHCTKVFGVESEKEAIRAAKVNAKAHEINATFTAAQVELILPVFLRRPPLNGTDLTVLLDPPRGGCAPAVVATLKRQPPKRLIYVSCEPSTLARDLKGLGVGTIFKLERLACADMFPQTAHLEAVAVLRRIEPEAG